MKKRRTKFISMLLAVVIVFSLMPLTVNADVPSGHNHDGWTALTQETLNSFLDVNSYKLNVENNINETYNYYLTEDIKMEYQIDVSHTIGGSSTTDKDVINICLNGHMIECVNLDETFHSYADGESINIYDCNGSHIQHAGYVDSEGLWHAGNPTNGETPENITGGVITGKPGWLFSCANGGEITMNGGTIIGCDNGGKDRSLLSASGFNNFFQQISHWGNVILDGVIIRENMTENRELMGASSYLELTIKNCDVSENMCSSVFDSHDVDNVKLNISDSSIRDNIVTSNGCIVLLENNVLSLTGNVIITDNYMNGEQRNICFSGGNPINANNLTSNPQTIGISFLTGLQPTESKTIGSSGGAYSSVFFSDDPRYYITGDNDSLLIKHRLLTQPSEANNYCMELCTDGLSGVSYNWGDVGIKEKYIDNTNYFEFCATYDENTKEWTPDYEYPYESVYFAIQAEAGETFKCDLEFDSNVFTEDSQFGYYGANTGAYDTVNIQSNDEVSLEFNKTDIYEIGGGCFGASTTADMLKIKNARLLKTSMGNLIAGQTTNTLTYKDDGKFICEAKVTDSKGTTKSIFSNVVELMFERFNVTFDLNGQGTSIDPQSVVIGEKAAIPDEPKAYNYRFIGWFTEPECVTTYDFETPVTSDITLYAGWKYDKLANVEGGVNVITGVDDTMEYRNVNSSDWIAITTTQIDNVLAGDYYVRIKADGTLPPSDSVMVTVTDPNPDPLPPEPEEQPYYIESLEDQLDVAIAYAQEDEMIVWTEGDSLPQSVIDLILQSDVTVEFKFTYEGVDYDLFLNKFNVKDLKLDWYGPYVLAQFANNTAVGAEELEGDTYTVKEGDTMGAIAERFGMSLEALTALNPQITDIDFIRVNQKIRVK